MGLLNRAFVCLLMIIPLANSELNSRKSPRDINLISGKITSFTGAGQHDLRANIPGEPGVDYPIYSSPPDTSFSCFNKHEGYYADVETRCQVFRICSHTDHTGKGFAFLCPNGTLFSQHDFVCDWYKNVPCENSPNYYFMNELLDKSVSPQPDLLMKDVVAMVNYPMKVINQQKAFSPAVPQPPRVIFTTPRPVGVSFPTQPSLFTKAPPALIQPATLPVRNPFESITQGPPKKLFEPSTENPHIERPQIENSPQFPNIEQIRPELISPPTPAAPEIAPASTPEYSPTLNNFDPSKIYISNLGELSTDPGSNFDPKTAVILPDKSQEQSPIFTQAGNQEHLLEGKIDPPQSEANKNLLLNLENIASSIPGNINSQLALVRDQPLAEGGIVQIPGTLHVSLNYTQRINTALKNVLRPPGSTHLPDMTLFLSGDGKLISEIYGQNKLQTTNGLLKFAHNINSAFQVNNPALGLNSQEAKGLLNSADQEATSFGSETGRGAGFSTISTPYGSDGRPKTQSFTSAPGQPTSVQGFGFTKSNLAVSTPASILHTQTIYIPSINLKQNPSSEKTTDVTATSEPHLLLDQIPDTVHNTRQLGNDNLGQDQDQLTAAANHYGSDLERLRQNGLGDSKNHAKRAESLLLKGVQLSIYDATKTDNLIDNDNRIDVTDNAPLQSTEKTISTTAQIFSVSEQQDTDDTIVLENISTTTEDVSRSLPSPTVSYESSPSPTQHPSTPSPESLPAFSIAFETTTPIQLMDTHTNVSDFSTDEAMSTTFYTESNLREESSTASTENLTTLTPQTKHTKPKNRFFTRARKTKPTLTTTDTTLVITTTVDKMNLPSDSLTTTEATNSYGIRAALSKSRKNIKKVIILKRPKLSPVEGTNHPNNHHIDIRNLSKIKFTSTITSSSNSSTSSTSTSASSNTTNNTNNSNQHYSNENSSTIFKSPLRKYRNTYKNSTAIAGTGDSSNI